MDTENLEEKEVILTSPTPKCRGFTLTIFDYDEKSIELLEKHRDTAEVGFQLERCPTTGKKHIQGYVYYANARTWNELKTMFPTAHIERMKGDLKSNRKYCSKEQTRLINSPLDNKELYVWQQNIINLLNTTPDERTIHWYWSAKGNIGKTSFAKHCCITFPRSIYVSGKSADIKYGIATATIKPTIVFIDLPRSTDDKFISYEALESIKNGIFFCGKYESQMVIYDCPHLIVFANREPDIDKLSIDRWNIIELQ